MENTKNSINVVQGVVIVAIGAALYGLGGLIGIPIFANTTIKPAMAILALFSGIYGPIIGFLVGFLGHLITDSLAGWGIWITWVIGSGIVGIVGGLYPIITKNSIEKGLMDTKQIGLFILLAFIGNFVGYMISAVLDYFIYTEPLNKVITQQLLIAFVNTVVIAILGTLLMKLVASRNASKQNLVEEKKDDEINEEDKEK